MTLKQTIIKNGKCLLVLRAIDKYSEHGMSMAVKTGDYLESNLAAYLVF